jgi:DNA mismatch repair protein MutS
MAKTKEAKETPLMKQYNAIKAKYPGALLLFRVGDFYETFGEDAIKASKILDIVLTKRSNGAASHVELAGFPHHALDAYLPKLVRAGQRVAICDQLEDPKTVKGIVKRGVTELVTPGLSMHDNVLEQGRNNFLASLFIQGDLNGIAFLDLSTGEFFVAKGDLAYLEKLVQGFQPSEIIYNKSQKSSYEGMFHNDYHSFHLEEWIYAFDFGYEKLIRQFQVNNLKGFGIEEMKEAIIAAGAILHYLDDTEHKEISHISHISRLEEEHYMWLDRFTVRNLELVHSPQSDGIPLINILDQVITPMGSRLLRKWIVLPLKEKEEIQYRLHMVEALFDDKELLEELTGFLKPIGDMERLVSKVATGRINPRELIQLKKGIRQLEAIKSLLIRQEKEILFAFGDRIDLLQSLLNHLDATLQQDPPMQLHQGNVICDGVDEELDEYRKIAFSGKDYLLQVQKREMEKTGINSLKITFP